MSLIPISKLATTFVWSGLFMTMSSAGALVFCLICEIRRRLAGEITAGQVGKNPDAILLMLKGIVETFAMMGRLTAWLGQMLVYALALLAGIGLVCGLALLFTGRGLQAEAAWARIGAIILILLAMMPPLAIAFSAGTGMRLMALGLLLLFAFGLHSLWNGYTPQTP